MYLDNRLQVVPPGFRHPARGESAFQTDLCIFEHLEPDVVIPRVVLEFKLRLTTHDMLTYSAKAGRHKQVYPYLRYGLVTADRFIPGRFFTHNEALDFGIAAGHCVEHPEDMRILLKPVVEAEIKTSRLLENIAFGKGQITVFRHDVLVDYDASPGNQPQSPIGAIGVFRCRGRLGARAYCGGIEYYRKAIRLCFSRLPTDTTARRVTARY